jgi:nucleoside-diphosphate-sugar epimerase
MRVFLTGATGHVGSAVLSAFARRGHEVVALVRHPGKAERLAASGLTAIVGDVERPETYCEAATTCDVVVHTALDRGPRGPLIDGTATAALLDAAATRVRRGLPAAVLYTSSVWVLGDVPAGAGEEAALHPTPFVAWRPAQEEALLRDASASHLRAAIVRPGIVYGGAEGLVGQLLRDAANGLLRVVGDGTNRWASVYDRDLADLYIRLAEHPDAAGIFHATDEAHERVIDVVDAVAQHMRTTPEVRHLPIGEARAKLGPFADALALDQVVLSPRARAIGWAPTLHAISGSIARLLEEFRSAREAA